MALTITFTPKGMTSGKYDEVIRRLEAAGQGAPKGRHYHTAFGPQDALRVVDVWENQETFESFGAVLIPILSSLGVEVGTPDVQVQYNSIFGKQ